MGRIVNVVFAFALAAGLGVAGCATPAPAPATGESLADHGPYARAAGDPAPGFTFVAEGNRLETFSGARGDVTLVLFPEDPAWPDCEVCREVALLAQGLSDDRVDVRAVSLGRPESGAGDALARLEACAIPSDHLVAITDRGGTIREVWGAGAGGSWFVVDRRGRIAATGPVSDLAAAERLLREAVDEETALLDEFPTD